MNRRRTTPALFAALLLLAGAGPLPALIITYTWTGQGSDNNWYTDQNWDVAPAPNDYGNANVVFGDSSKTDVALYRSPNYSINVRGLTISGNTSPYYFDGDYDGYLTMTIGAGGITYNPAQPVRSAIAADFAFVDDQTWNIASGTLVLKGNLYGGDGGYVFTKTGAGTLVFEAADNGDLYSATINLNNGRLVLSAASYYSYGPLGSADLVIGPATLGNNPIIVANDNSNDNGVTLGNNITLNGALTTENKSELRLTGPVTLNADTTVTSKGKPLVIEGNIDEATVGKKLTINSAGAVILAGTNGYTGGTSVTKGVLVFENNLAVPATGQLSAASSGYIGRMFDPTGATTPLASYLGKFDQPNTHGTIGFDTDPALGGTAGAFNNFSEAIVLTHFATDARLGSATQAMISGGITPQGTNYQFGGGNGLLIVSSQLSGSRAVTADSPVQAPLTVGLGSMLWNAGTAKFDPATHAGNSFSGGVTARYSAVVFGPGAMPATGNFTLQDGGYIGNADPGVSPADFLLRFPTSTNLGMIGFDYFGDGTASVAGDIDLTRFTGGSVYLGTTTQAVLSGIITPQGSTYRFAAYKAGELEVASQLTGAKDVVIGDPNSPATFGDYSAQKHATVKLTGNNNYTGGTTFYGGRLVVGQSNDAAATNALGSGALTVNAFPFPTPVTDLFVDGESPSPRLEAASANLIVPNAVVLNTELNAGGDNNFTLAGNISGTGELYVGEDSINGFTLTLSGTNTFSGGVYVAQGAIVNAGTDTALGGGPLGFGYSGGRVNFQSSAPVIGSLMTKDESDYAYLYAGVANTVLTINQTDDSLFRGEFRSQDASDALRVVKTGAGVLRLDDGGLYYHHGTVETGLGGGNPEVGLQVNQGTLVLGSNFSVEDSAPTVWVHGGTLALDRDSSGNNNPVYNPIVVDGGGRLAGNGKFASSVTIGTGTPASAIVSPGLAGQGGIGALHFDELTLGGGGGYEWNVNSATPEVDGTYDQIFITQPTTLIFASTSTSRFTLKVISLQLSGAPGLVDGFTGDRSYTWNLIVGDSTSGTFDPNTFTLDTSQFSSNLPGSFTLSLSGSNLQLTFQPIPEPSAYALLALGLGVVAMRFHRRLA